MLKPDNFFDLEGIPFLGLFENVEYVWEALKKIQEYIKENIEPNVSNLRRDGSVVYAGKARNRPKKIRGNSWRWS